MEENNEQDNFKQNDDDHLLKAVVDMIGMLVCPNNKSSLFFLGKKSLIDDILTSIKIS